MTLQAVRPRVTFGIIVLNGEPFTRYALRALYPYAFEIIVVEGAAPGAANVARPDGHSSDGTLESLDRFKTDEDPDNKVTIVTAEDEGFPNGFWPGEKDQQSAAYARRARGAYLWQVDIDEFYLPEDMSRVMSMLLRKPEIDAVSFNQITFWGGLEYVADGWYLRRGAAEYHRLFKWGPSYRYSTHRPPTVLDERGRDLRTKNWMAGHATAAMGIHLLHYSLLFPKQVMEKCDYYANAPWAQRADALDWAQGAFMQLRKPYRVHNVYAYPSWLERYRGRHPELVLQMMSDVRSTRSTEVRATEDIERLLQSPAYGLGRVLLKLVDPAEARTRWIVHLLRRQVRVLKRWVTGRGIR